VHLTSIQMAVDDVTMAADGKSTVASAMGLSGSLVSGSVAAVIQADG